MIIRHFFPKYLDNSAKHLDKYVDNRKETMFQNLPKRLTILPNILTTNCTLTHPHLCHLDNLGHRHKPRPEISLLLIVNPNIKARYSVISNIMNYEIFSAHLMNAIVLVPATELIARANLHNKWLSYRSIILGNYPNILTNYVFDLYSKL